MIASAEKLTEKSGIHIGLIPDGNRRYATKNGKMPWEGHLNGTEKMKDFLKWCLEGKDVNEVSVYALSTENLKRGKEELNYLWKIYTAELSNLLADPTIKKNDVKVNIVGDSSLWIPEVKDLVEKVTKATEQHKTRKLNILLAYGAQFEINSIFHNLNGHRPKSIDEMLMVKEPLDLLIRTGGQRRMSNFLLYQSAYAELYFTDTLWPEFSKQEFQKAVDWYWEQQKNFGK